ncbi:MAG: hypothetical protein KDK38_11620, partial [Leptospiraceae bacterium]|nr:hypothetical protein [Leptospiraceae bacterium]
VFRSPFVSMRVNGDTVTQIDHLRDRSQSLPLDQFKWVEVFGKVFPFGFFYPILKGYPPEVIFDPTANYSLPKPGQERLTVKKQDWEAIVNFESQIMTSVFFRTMNDKEIVILAFSGKQNTARYFPGEILVTRPNSNDFIKIQFKSMKVQ